MSTMAWMTLCGPDTSQTTAKAHLPVYPIWRRTLSSRMALLQEG